MSPQEKKTSLVFFQQIRKEFLSMARDLRSSCRKCRREGEKLFLKGARCYTHRCSVDRRAYAPGEHGLRRIKLSNYGLQLREKQKVKRIYGLLEKQFRIYFSRVVRKKGVTGTPSRIQWVTASSKRGEGSYSIT